MECVGRSGDQGAPHAHRGRAEKVREIPRWSGLGWRGFYPLPVYIERRLWGRAVAALAGGADRWYVAITRLT